MRILSADFEPFKKWLGKLEIAPVVYEPTGPYHRNFEERFCDKLPLVKVNPLQARCGTCASKQIAGTRNSFESSITGKSWKAVAMKKAFKIGLWQTIRRAQRAAKKANLR